MTEGIDQDTLLLLVVGACNGPVGRFWPCRLRNNESKSVIHEEVFQQLNSVVVERPSEKDRRGAHADCRCRGQEFAAKACERLELWAERSTPRRDDVSFIDDEVCKAALRCEREKRWRQRRRRRLRRRDD